jgi:hypothetical protein
MTVNSIQQVFTVKMFVHYAVILRHPVGVQRWETWQMQMNDVMVLLMVLSVVFYVDLITRRGKNFLSLPCPVWLCGPPIGLLWAVSLVA